jgi:hypothetical protein
VGVGAAGGALDLKLGGPTSWMAAATSFPSPLAPSPRPSASAPSKRAHRGQAHQVVSACFVEGCAADLSKSCDYHRCHKVCEAHPKMLVVTAVAGQQQRFCQHCSRSSVRRFEAATGQWSPPLLRPRRCFCSAHLRRNPPENEGTLFNFNLFLNLFL